MTENKEIKRIAGPLANLGPGQIGYEVTPDSVLGYAMWGGKDAAGNVSKWLAKGKPGLLTTLQLTGTTTTGKVGFLKHDENGNIIGGYSTVINSDTENVAVTSPANETFSGEATVLNTALAEYKGVINTIIDSLERLVSVSVGLQVNPAIVPWAITGTPQVLDFSERFASTDEELITFDADAETITFHKDGRYQWGSLFVVSNTLVNPSSYHQLAVATIDTTSGLSLYTDEADGFRRIQIPATGYSDTTSVDFEVTGAPVTVNIQIFAEDENGDPTTDLTLEDWRGTLSAISVTGTGIVETAKTFTAGEAIAAGDFFTEAADGLAYIVEPSDESAAGKIYYCTIGGAVSETITGEPGPYEVADATGFANTIYLGYTGDTMLASPATIAQGDISRIIGSRTATAFTFDPDRSFSRV